MRFLIPLPKLLKHLASLIFVCSKSQCTIRELASVRGRSRHYTVCIRHILPFIPIFSAVLGTDQKMDYDGIIDIPPIMTETADLFISVVNQYTPLGQPLHQYVPSSLYHALISNKIGQSHIVSITHYMVRVLSFDGGVTLMAVSLLVIFLHLKICNIKYEEKQRQECANIIGKLLLF